jgi:cleavage and polyadenylation specificity factor subunit 1
VTRFYLVKEHRLHGIVTGMEAVKIVTTHEDHLDRLLVSFKDAKVSSLFLRICTMLTKFYLKIALLEWSDAIHDLITVSIHTYERAPQLVRYFFFFAFVSAALHLCSSPSIRPCSEQS